MLLSFRFITDPRLAEYFENCAYAKNSGQAGRVRCTFQSASSIHESFIALACNSIVRVSEQEAADVKRYILRLNSVAAGGTVVAVEGKRDRIALRRLGYEGTILEFNRFGGITDFVDNAATYDSIVLLFDADRKGRYMTSRISRLLQRRIRVDAELRRRLWQATRGRVMFIEQIACYGQEQHTAMMM